MKNQIQSIFQEAVTVQSKISEDSLLIEQLEQCIQKITDCFRNGGKLLVCGNGGSAGQAEHLVAEFTGRFKKDRPPLDAATLFGPPSQLTAIANDYGYHQVFKRALMAAGKPGDILLCLTTSGNSENILEALAQSGEMGVYSILWTGAKGGRAADMSDMTIRAPHSDTARIQECHLIFCHIVCELIERDIFG